jgi:glycosyltransferase involved in cell wall biosynthesis
MAAAVLELLGDAELAERLVGAGAEECRRKYAWSAAKQSWVDLYRDLARGSAMVGTSRAGAQLT